jgi:uncharacterized protein YaiE (UPF0345 family)
VPATGDGEAARTAKYIAQANNEAAPGFITRNITYNQPGITVTFPPYPLHSGYVTTDDGSSISVRLGEAIRVQATVTVPMSFAGLIGINSVDVHAEATAIVGTQAPTPVTVITSALPWAVADSTIWTSSSPPQIQIQMGDRVSLKIVNPSDPYGFIGPGNFLAVAYAGDHGADDYRDRIAGTKPPTTFHLDEPITLGTEPGNMSGPTEQGLTSRLQSDIYAYPSANSTAWNSWLASYDPYTGQRATTKRFGMAPIVHDPGGLLNGRSTLQLVGFAGVFIEGFETVTEGEETFSRVAGRFTSGIYSASGITWIDPNVDPPYSSTVTSVRLIK